MDDTGQILILSSITYAMKSRELLFRFGIRAYVERLPRTKETGCGYGVYVPQGVEEAERILRENGVRILGRTKRGGGTA